MTRRLASIAALVQLGDDVFNIIGDLVIELSLDGICLDVLGPDELLYEPRTTFISRRIADVLPGPPAVAILEALERLRAGEGSQTFEYAARAADGLHHHEARLVMATSGNALMLVRNIDDRKRVELRVRESEERFRTMADSAPVMLWMAGLDGLCEFFNEGWLRFTGRPLARELGNGWAEGVHAEDFQRCMHVYMNAFVERQSFSMYYRLRRSDGEYRWLYDQGRPRFAPEGTFMGYIGSCVDVTEERSAREALARLNEDLEGHVRRRTAQLEVANRELEAFAYSASHDLRAPLRAMSGYSQLLIEDHALQIDDEGRDMLQRMHDASVKMAELIDGLLHLSRMTRADMQRESVDLSALAHSIIDELRLEEPTRNVSVEILAGLRAEGDPQLLRIMLDNLLRNAWKFTSKLEHARLSLRSERLADGHMAFVLTDNGAGFDMAYASKLFGPFNRLHSNSEFPGSGIGLATVQRIVSRHGGKVWAEGVVGEGARFYFTL